MAETSKLPPQYVTEDHASDGHNGDVVDGKVQTEEVFEIDDSQKLGVTSAVFLILNKMIGTGSKSDALAPSRHQPESDEHQSSQHPPASSQSQAQSA